MRIITVGNQKGGVGKTTVSVHLAFRAAELGHRVLLVDLDEGDVAEVFQPDELDVATDFLVASQLFTTDFAGRKPRPVRERIDLIEADVDVLDVDDMPLDAILSPRASLAGLAGDYDLCILDTPPNLQRRMLGALVASDAVLSPFSINPFSFARMPKLVGTIDHVRAEYNPSLQHLGFLPNLVNSKSSNEMQALPELREAYGDLIFEEAVIARACVATALAQGKAVWQRARGGNERAAAREMRLACDAVLSRLGMARTKDK